MAWFAPGHIGEGARVTAVDTRGAGSADWAGHDRLCGGHAQDEPRGGVVQVPSIKLKYGGLRSDAWKDGRCLPA